MIGKKSTTFFMIFFLVQSILYASDFSPRTFSLTPVTKVSSNNAESQIFDKFSIVYNSLLIYKLDVVDRLSKGEIIKLLYSADTGVSGNSSLKFDLDNIDMMKRGWTRYYPFSLSGKLYVVRIFRTDEAVYQPEMEVVFEAQMGDPKVTVQVLGDINAMLTGREIKKHEVIAAVPVPNM